MDANKEARAALDEINDVIRSTKQRLAHGPAGVLLVTWGAIWFVIFLGVHIQPQMVNWLPIIGCAIGMATFWLARRSGIETRGSERPGDLRIGLAWLVLTAYAILWMLILHPQRQPNSAVSELIDANNHVLAFFATVGMFGYVVGGLWFGRFFVILGLVVTVLILVGLYAMPQWFLIWMAFVGGGALVFSGVLIKRLWGSVSELNKVIHEPARLRIMATLIALRKDEQIDFGSLGKLLELSDGNLGSHLQKLESACYVDIEKTFEGKRPKTFVSLTTEGRNAFRAHVKALERILYE